MRSTPISLAIALTVAGCSGSDSVDDGNNPFAQDLPDSGKEDSAYMNPDGIEVEVDLEGDVVASASKIDDAPIAIGQFALTYFRKQEKMFIESLAEDGLSADRTEWQHDGRWYTSANLPSGATKKHWRLRGLNAVLLFEHADVEEGATFVAKVPLKPFSVLTDAGKTCADSDDHIELDQSVYWYRWEPEQAGCTIGVQDLQVTVSKKFPELQSARYPEYDQLIADRKITSVVLFGQIADGTLRDTDPGMMGARQIGRNLKAAGYREVTAPVGTRYEKKLRGDILSQIDVYSPREFAGLDDDAHFDNFQKALLEHEIVAYDGHSMLGASDFWSRPEYPGFYQIFLYGGCLGYEYYVRPILHGKGDSWKKLDLMSSVVEVTASANEFAAPAIAKILNAVEYGRRSSWRNVLLTVRDNVGDSTFGISGVRDNCFTPTGSRCR